MQKSLYGSAQILSLRDGFLDGLEELGRLHCSRFCYSCFLAGYGCLWDINLQR